MLSLGLTGGIAAGKSLVSQRLAELGAVLIDADRLAREVVEPGTEGLAEITREFGVGMLTLEGDLDRPTLGALVFENPGARRRLNAIVHPRVRARAAELRAAAPEGAIVVQDIPLLVETGQGPAFHLVIVVDAPESLQLTRMTHQRGMSEAEARSRIAAQASRSERLAAADIVIDNSGQPEDALRAAEELWENRLLPFAANLAAGIPADRAAPPVLASYDPGWPAQAERLAARIRSATGASFPVDHIGSTSVPGLPAKDVLDLQLRVPSLPEADALAPLLSQAGFPPLSGVRADSAKAFAPDPAQWQKRLHVNADPGREVNLHLRVEGSPGADYALAFRDWLRAEPQARAAYLAEKQRLAGQFAQDPDTSRYAAAKEPWFDAMEPALLAWKERTGWQAPQP